MSNSKQDFIADDIEIDIAMKELTLNLENQGYLFASKISKHLENITIILIKLNLI